MSSCYHEVVDYTNVTSCDNDMCCFSAGVGRTGTFICVDHLLQHIRDYDGINVFGMVLEMRQYRCNMVQT